MFFRLSKSIGGTTYAKSHYATHTTAIIPSGCIFQFLIRESCLGCLLNVFLRNFIANFLGKSKDLIDIRHSLEFFLKISVTFNLFQEYFELFF